MDYEKKYKEALERLKGLIEGTREDKCAIVGEDIIDIFPELAESEEERIRKDFCKDIWTYIPNEKAHKYIAWLEKQGEKPKKVSIWKHWTSGIAGNGEGEVIYLIKDGYTYSLSSCLGCECDYIELSELDKLMREEKQGEHEPTDNNEKLDVLNFIRKETCCGLAEANNALLKLIKVLKEHPFPIMDKPRKLKIEWEE